MKTDKTIKFEELKAVALLFEEKKEQVNYAVKRMDELTSSLTKEVDKDKIAELIGIEDAVNKLMLELDGLENNYYRLIKEIKNGNK